MNSSPAAHPSAVIPEPAVRELAYFRWLALGRPEGDDLAHWFWARQQLAGASQAAELQAMSAPGARGRISFHRRKEDQGDSTHRFHDRRLRDARIDVVAGEAPQRVRGRHFDRSLRTQPRETRS